MARRRFQLPGNFGGSDSDFGLGSFKKRADFIGVVGGMGFANGVQEVRQARRLPALIDGLLRIVSSGFGAAELSAMLSKTA